MNILLRNLSSYLQVEAPSDMIMAVKPVTLDANGFAVVDLKNDVREGSIVYYTLLGQSNVWHLATKAAEGLDVDKGQALIGIAASTETDPVDDPITVIPDDSTSAVALIFYSASDMARHGESFV